MALDLVNLEDLTKLAAFAFRDTLSDRGSISEEQIREMLQSGAEGLKPLASMPRESLDEIVGGALALGTPSGNFDYNRRHLARWFEIELDDFDESPVELLRPEVLFRHIFYERSIKEWFEDWGYEVEIGEEFHGVEGTEFVPDVYAQLETLHGKFDVAICLFCAKPASTARVLARLENIEAFAIEGSDFASADLFMLVTPHQFSEQATNHIRLQTQQEAYSVVPVEGNHLQTLESESDPRARKQRLQDIIQDWLARAQASGSANR